jgi:methylmalonyl-CoA/ethylmalonyl-CoA epimerase
MIKKIDHVALAVQDAGEVSGLLSKLFGFEVAEKREEPKAGFTSTLISSAEVSLELLQPVGPQGMIQKFIEKRGGGLHHISIRVDNLDEEMARLKGLGVQFASEEAAQVDDSKVIFVHPRSTSGLLIELIQRK